MLMSLLLRKSPKSKIKMRIRKLMIRIGKGFAGVMKRHGFKGLKATHGVSLTHRSGGSTGQHQVSAIVLPSRHSLTNRTQDVYFPERKWQVTWV
jgi:hypothetical protein